MSRSQDNVTLPILRDQEDTSKLEQQPPRHASDKPEPLDKRSDAAASRIDKSTVALVLLLLSVVLAAVGNLYACVKIGTKRYEPYLFALLPLVSLSLYAHFLGPTHDPTQPRRLRDRISFRLIFLLLLASALIAAGFVFHPLLIARDIRMWQQFVNPEVMRVESFTSLPVRRSKDHQLFDVQGAAVLFPGSSSVAFALRSAPLRSDPDITICATPIVPFVLADSQRGVVFPDIAVAAVGSFRKGSLGELSQPIVTENATLENCMDHMGPFFRTLEYSRGMAREEKERRTEMRTLMLRVPPYWNPAARPSHEDYIAAVHEMGWDSSDDSPMFVELIDWIVLKELTAAAWGRVLYSAVLLYVVVFPIVSLGLTMLVVNYYLYPRYAAARLPKHDTSASLLLFITLLGRLENSPFSPAMAAMVITMLALLYIIIFRVLLGVKMDLFVRLRVTE